MIACTRTFKINFVALMHYVFAVRISDKALRDSIHSAFNRITYRFPLNATKDWLISLRILKLLFSNTFKIIKFKTFSENSGIAIFDVSFNGEELRKNYIERLTGSKIQMFVSRDELIKSPSVSLALVKLFYLLLVSPSVFILSVFCKNKLAVPFHLLNSIEAQNMTRILKENNINELHYFCIYEADSNLMAYSLMKNGIKVNKIPSEVPLQFLNRTIVADTLSFCFRYQEDEYNLYKDTMHVTKLQHWIPEGSLKLEEFYLKNRITPEKTIGFYSSAMWYRKEIDTMDLLKADEYEKELLENLIDYIKANPQNKLIVFLHPIEKKNLDKAKSHYGSYGIPFEFADISMPNSKLFCSADVVVSLYSTLAFERIFWGFKTLIYPLGQEEFPIRGSAFSAICYKSKSELFNGLNSALNLNSDEFFMVNKIENYIYKDYPFFRNK